MGANVSNYITAENISIGYTKTPLCNNMHFHIGGGITAITGLNGVGKSTLLATLCNIHKPIGGAIYLYGKNINQYPARDIAKKISIVFTGRAMINQGLTVRELLQIARFPHMHVLRSLSKQDHVSIDASIEMMHIGAIVNKKMYQLSDGEMQKALITKALVQQTDFIFLDEPTAHLDIQNSIATWQLIRRLSTAGKHIIFTTHDLHAAYKLAENILFIEKGGTYFFGSKIETLQYEPFRQLFALASSDW